MSDLNPQKLHVTYKTDPLQAGSLLPRRYTLTHSDSTGDLFLTVGAEFDQAQISGWYTRFLRDEVLAEWRDEEAPRLHVFCHLSGGLVLGSPAWRYSIFQKHMRQVLEAFRNGDRALFETRPDLDQAPVRVHFLAKQARYNRVEDWGRPAQYRVEELAA
jgi:hypothetical protein